METLRKHYDALGSFLHVPTLKQTRSGKAHDPEKQRKRCTEIADYIEHVLASPVYNVRLGSFFICFTSTQSRLGSFATIECAECGEPIRKRMPASEKTVEAECSACKASYTLRYIGGKQVKWEPHVRQVACGNRACGHKFEIWHREFAEGTTWTCPDCDGCNTILLGIHHEEAAKS